MNEEYEEMNERDLWILACEYPALSEWKKVAIDCLDLDGNDLFNIECKYLIRDGIKECFYQSLLLWRLRDPENCNKSYFLKRLSNHYNVNDFSIKKQPNENQSFENKLANGYGKRILDEDELWKVSEVLAMEWKPIARYLGVSELELKNIEFKYIMNENDASGGMRECCYQSLLIWSQQNYDNASLDKLLLAVMQLKYNLFVKQIIRLF